MNTSTIILVSNFVGIIECLIFLHMYSRFRKMRIAKQKKHREDLNFLFVDK